MTHSDEQSGLQSNSFADAVDGAACRGRDGRLYFGGAQGWNGFDPEEIESLFTYYGEGVEVVVPGAPEAAG